MYIKWASRAALCSWVSMNSGKTFCQTSIDALKKRCCCQKCCERTGMHIAWLCLAIQIYNNYMHTASCRITAILSYLIGSLWHPLRSLAMLPVFLAHLKSLTVTLAVFSWWCPICDCLNTLMYMRTRFIRTRIGHHMMTALRYLGVWRLQGKTASGDQNNSKGWLIHAKKKIGEIFPPFLP